MIMKPERFAHGIRVAKAPLRRLLVVRDLRLDFLRRAMLDLIYHTFYTIAKSDCAFATQARGTFRGAAVASLVMGFAEVLKWLELLLREGD